MPSTAASTLPPATPESDRLAIENLRLVGRYARTYAMRTSVEFDDLQAVGYLGLIKASRRFDPDQGYRFSTFAVPVIIGTIKQYLRDRGFHVRFPIRWRDAGPRVRQLARDGKHTIQQIAELVGLSYDETTELLWFMAPAKEIDAIQSPELRDAVLGCADPAALEDGDHQADHDHALYIARIALAHIAEADRDALTAFWREDLPGYQFPDQAIQQFRRSARAMVAHQPLPAVAEQVMLGERQEDIRARQDLTKAQLEQRARDLGLFAQAQPTPSRRVSRAKKATSSRGGPRSSSRSAPA